MRTNNRRLQRATVHWTTGRPASYRYIINCWNNRRQHDTCRVKSWVPVQLVLRQGTSQFIARSVSGKMMMLSVVLSDRFTVNKMITEISMGRKHELTNDMMKRAKGKNCEMQRSKPDDFLRAV